MNQPATIRQGDILLVPVAPDAIPARAKRIRPINGRHILAHGEATGHHHSIAATKSTALLAAPNDEMFLLVTEGDALLEHQEHSPHVLRGPYRVIRQREFTPAAPGLPNTSYVRD